MTDIIFQTAGVNEPAVVLLHAFPLNAAAWSDQMSALADAAALSAPDMPGFGASQGVEPIDHIDGLAAAMIVSARARGIRDAMIVGNSMGGYLAFAMLRVEPAFVRTLALINTRATADTDQGRSNRLAMVERVQREGCGFLVDEWPQGAVSPSTVGERPGVMDSIRKMIRQATPQGVIAAQRAMAGRPDSTPLLATIQVPTLVIHGLDDPIVPATEARAMAAAIPGAAFVGVPGAGHLPQLEDPVPVNAALRGLLEATR